MAQSALFASSSSGLPDLVADLIQDASGNGVHSRSASAPLLPNPPLTTEVLTRALSEVPGMLPETAARVVNDPPPIELTADGVVSKILKPVPLHSREVLMTTLPPSCHVPQAAYWAKQRATTYNAAFHLPIKIMRENMELYAAWHARNLLSVKSFKELGPNQKRFNFRATKFTFAHACCPHLDDTDSTRDRSQIANRCSLLGQDCTIVTDTVFAFDVYNLSPSAWDIMLSRTHAKTGYWLVNYYPRDGTLPDLSHLGIAKIESRGGKVKHVMDIADKCYEDEVPFVRGVYGCQATQNGYISWKLLAQWGIYLLYTISFTTTGHQYIPEENDSFVKFLSEEMGWKKTSTGERYNIDHWTIAHSYWRVGMTSATLVNRLQQSWADKPNNSEYIARLCEAVVEQAHKDMAKSKEQDARRRGSESAFSSYVSPIMQAIGFVQQLYEAVCNHSDRVLKFCEKLVKDLYEWVMEKLRPLLSSTTAQILGKLAELMAALRAKLNHLLSCISAVFGPIVNPFIKLVKTAYDYVSSLFTGQAAIFPGFCAHTGEPLQASEDGRHEVINQPTEPGRHASVVQQILPSLPLQTTTTPHQCVSMENLANNSRLLQIESVVQPGVVEELAAETDLLVQERPMELLQVVDVNEADQDFRLGSRGSHPPPENISPDVETSSRLSSPVSQGTCGPSQRLNSSLNENTRMTQPDPPISFLPEIRTPSVSGDPLSMRLKKNFSSCPTQARNGARIAKDKLSRKCLRRDSSLSQLTSQDLMRMSQRVYYSQWSIVSIALCLAHLVDALSSLCCSNTLAAYALSVALTCGSAARDYLETSILHWETHAWNWYLSAGVSERSWEHLPIRELFWMGMTQSYLSGLRWSLYLHNSCHSLCHRQVSLSSWRDLLTPMRILNIAVASLFIPHSALGIFAILAVSSGERPLLHYLWDQLRRSLVAEVWHPASTTAQQMCLLWARLWDSGCVRAEDIQDIALIFKRIVQREQFATELRNLMTQNPLSAEGWIFTLRQGLALLSNPNARSISERLVSAATTRLTTQCLEDSQRMTLEEVSSEPSTPPSPTTPVQDTSSPAQTEPVLPTSPPPGFEDVTPTPRTPELPAYTYQQLINKPKRKCPRKFRPYSRSKKH